jgi:hypothetical protein
MLNGTKKSPDSFVSTAKGWRARVQFPKRARYFSFLHGVQSSSTAHQAAYWQHMCHLICLIASRNQAHKMNFISVYSWKNKQRPHGINSHSISVITVKLLTSSKVMTNVNRNQTQFDSVTLKSQH